MRLVVLLISGCSALVRVNFNEIPGLAGGEVGKPGVIVIQEWWGLTPQVEAHAEKIAAMGYRVLVPDIYKGASTVEAEEAHHMMANLDFPNAIREIAQGAAWLKEEGSPTVGVVGFCMGGALTLGALAASPDIVAGAPFYGVNFDLFGDLAGKAIQAHFGALDAFEGFADPGTAAKLQRTCPHAEVYVYDGVGHAFMNDTPSPFKTFEAREAKMGFPPFDRAQADLAWSRLFEFFNTHLSASSPPDL
ncbi:hypothetical protein CTAYLR_000657 [Chrysophaeum taylorii]|uniref:Dienelactone hydrolase domain-containing protein n=1 Tax=Chrysophaeum taylorii TaxID=2483200 RepID=A0AAD7U8J1_9STRA|nr:hypothetical protein CTAYLR_000657 [Chrysophaeum taylorii]